MIPSPPHGYRTRVMRNQLRTIFSTWREVPYTQFQAADVRSLAYDRLTERIAEASGHRVMHGPYKGMRYFGSEGIPIVDELPTTKLVGSFEEEVHPWIETLVARGFRNVIHLGSGEGYHAVGMALRLPEARSVVFDTLIAARKACKELADQNGVRDRMQLRGFCALDGLLDVELEGSLVFSDCGGAELSILDPKLYPALALSTMLVETHDAFDIRVTRRLMTRFSESHSIEFVAARPRDATKYQFLSSFKPDQAQAAVEENRAVTKDGKPQTWALFQPLVA